MSVEEKHGFDAPKLSGCSPQGRLRSKACLLTLLNVLVVIPSRSISGSAIDGVLTDSVVGSVAVSPSVSLVESSDIWRFAGSCSATACCPVPP